jgi:hypothetical protein
MVLKFRITNSEETLQLVRREADFFIQANQKRLKGVGTLLYSLPCGVGSMQFAAKLIWGDAHFAILAMRSWSLNGTDVQSSVHNCIKQSGGDIPDMARHLMRELLKIFSALHEKSMALGGNDWTGMALCHSQKLVLIEAGHALVVKENRNYVIPAVHAKASGPAQPQHLRPEDVESATLQSINLKLTDRNLCVLNGDGYLGPICLKPTCWTDTSAMTRWRLLSTHSVSWLIRNLTIVWLTNWSRLEPFLTLRTLLDAASMRPRSRVWLGCSSRFTNFCRDSMRRMCCGGRGHSFHS